ncbi:MAG: hypothetical protein Q7T11_03560 [Deltaproteobacteria bacterium]|nr:hypothetical protein [Deltaproteobacteria bacterium]
MPKRQILAILISLFVLPGMGHVYLGEKKKGYLMGILVCLILLWLAVFFEISLIRQIRGADGALQLASVFAHAWDAWKTHRHIYWSGFILTVVIWIYAGVDLCRKKP